MPLGHDLSSLQVGPVERQPGNSPNPFRSRLEKILGKPVGRGPDSCSTSSHGKCKQTTHGHQGVLASAAINLAFSFVADKEHANKLNFPQKWLVIAGHPVHLIRETCGVSYHTRGYCGYRPNGAIPGRGGEMGAEWT